MSSLTQKINLNASLSAHWFSPLPARTTKRGNSSSLPLDKEEEVFKEELPSLAFDLIKRAFYLCLLPLHACSFASVMAPQPLCSALAFHSLRLLFLCRPSKPEEIKELSTPETACFKVGKNGLGLCSLGRVGSLRFQVSFFAARVDLAFRTFNTQMGFMFNVIYV